MLLGLVTAELAPLALAAAAVARGTPLSRYPASEEGHRALVNPLDGSEAGWIAVSISVGTAEQAAQYETELAAARGERYDHRFSLFVRTSFGRSVLGCRP